MLVGYVLSVFVLTHANCFHVNLENPVKRDFQSEFENWANMEYARDHALMSLVGGHTLGKRELAEFSERCYFFPVQCINKRVFTPSGIRRLMQHFGQENNQKRTLMPGHLRQMLWANSQRAEKRLMLNSHLHRLATHQGYTNQEKRLMLNSYLNRLMNKEDESSGVDKRGFRMGPYLNRMLTLGFDKRGFMLGPYIHQMMEKPKEEKKALLLPSYFRRLLEQAQNESQ